MLKRVLSSLTVLLMSSPGATDDIQTPFLEGWQQTPLMQMERQARTYPSYSITGSTNTRVIALTYDDGPSNHTTDLLEVLDKHDVKATFFWMGSNMLRHPDIVYAAQKAGHTIASHSYSHARSPELNDTAFMENEFLRTQHVFQRLLGYQPSLYRAPYGDISNKQIELLAGNGAHIVGWSINTDDWLLNGKPNGANLIANAAKQHLHPGAIILMHDGGGNRSKTVKATDELIIFAKKQGYMLTTADQLLNLRAYLHGGTPAEASHQAVLE